MATEAHTHAPAPVNADAAMAAAEAALRERAPDRAVVAATSAVEQRQAEFDRDPSVALRGKLVDALLALGSGQLAGNDAHGANATLGEIQLHLAHGDRADREWGMRASAATRMRIAAAQAAGNHADAIAVIEQAFASIQGNSPDADAGRMQLLTTMLRSRIALEQAAEAEADIEQCRAIVGRLAKVMPPRANEIAKTSLLLHAATVSLLRGKPTEADARFGEGIATLDRIGGSDLKEMRQQFVQSWVRALNQQGRKAEAGALLMRSATGGGGGVGGGHHHGHDHAHHHRDHPADCDCGAH